jgi:hypothetical protein
VKAIGAVPFGKDATNGVLLLGDLAQRIDDPPQPVVIQAQAVKHCRGQAFCSPCVEVESVGVQNLGPPPPDRISGGDQRGGFAF